MRTVFTYKCKKCQDETMHSRHLFNYRCIKCGSTEYYDTEKLKYNEPDIVKSSDKITYSCSKCNNDSYQVGEIRAAGGFWSKIFDIQGAKFTSVTCVRCRHTDFYKADSSMLGNIFDLFTN